MAQLTAQITVPLELIDDKKVHTQLLAKRLKIPLSEIKVTVLRKRSIDARKRPPVFLLSYEVWSGKDKPEAQGFSPQLQNISLKPPIIIVGFGPAGMFAALRAIELGLKPIVIERGKPVRERRRDLALINREGIVNPESNYCFGEGGAGTFSDGKLYTRSKKRGDVERILKLMVYFGADPDILVEAHPHIGTNKLPGLVESIREQIIDCGGEIHFNTKLERLILKDNNGQKAKPGKTDRKELTVEGIKTSSGESITAKAVILATGHSARDIFKMLDSQGIEIEAKSFAIGVRVEHPQGLIDQVRYHSNPRPKVLPAASYSVVHQVKDRGVYSFCMCPGGIICPSATANDELVVNGWSPSKRNSPFANSGIVVEIKPEDLKPFENEGVFAAMAFQRSVEQNAFAAGGGAQIAPAQRLTDFVRGKNSQSLPACSYIPGLNPVNMADVLPSGIFERLQGGFKAFSQKLRGYLTEEAVVVAPESRTSSPVRIPRDRETLMHPQVEGLFPCAEGAGYAGGIMSAALDGEACMEAAQSYYRL